MSNTMVRPMIRCDFQRQISGSSYADLTAQISQIPILDSNDSELAMIFLVKLDELINKKNIPVEVIIFSVSYRGRIVLDMLLTQTIEWENICNHLLVQFVSIFA